MVDNWLKGPKEYSTRKTFIYFSQTQIGAQHQCTTKAMITTRVQFQSMIGTIKLCMSNQNTKATEAKLIRVIICTWPIAELYSSLCVQCITVLKEWMGLKSFKYRKFHLRKSVNRQGVVCRKPGSNHNTHTPKPYIRVCIYTIIHILFF